MKLLVVDDEPFVLDGYRCAFTEFEAGQPADRLRAMAQGLFSAPSAETPSATRHNNLADVTYLSQGKAAIEAVAQSLAEGAPYQVVFIDVRMPPGIDGKETAKCIRAIDPEINIVIVSAYSDHNVTDICEVAGPADKIYYISKPFAADEVNQMAKALSQRWENDRAKIEELREKIIELAASEARALHIANHDFLTGAPNRMAFQAELSARLKRPARKFALALLDLDRFKHINDVFGHAAGDDLLKQIHQALDACLSPGSFLARLGGDEFGILIDAPDQSAAEACCARMVAACTCGYSIFGSTVHVGASIGLVLDPVNMGHDVADLMRFADIALFAAKRDGKGQFQVFNEQMDQSARFRQSIETALRSAIARRELALHYQPIVDRAELRTVGFEALLRWDSQEHGSISPAVFIPVAEESALIHEIGEWVIESAIRDSLNWPGLYVSINLSSRQFRSATVIDILCRSAQKYGVAHERIQVEITETAIFEHSDKAAQVVARLQALGFRIALDDFGTGYSSLVNVRNFPLDCIKIDKSFIDGLGIERDSSVIVSSITHLARGLGLNVVAEGVETEVQCQALRVVGCNQLQGHIFGRAEPLQAALERLAAEAPEARLALLAPHLASG